MFVESISNKLTARRTLNCKLCRGDKWCCLDKQTECTVLFLTCLVAFLNRLKRSKTADSKFTLKHLKALESKAPVTSAKPASAALAH